MAIHEVKLKANGMEFSAWSSWHQNRLGKIKPSELLVLLHGFPDNKCTWKELWGYLEAGFPKGVILAPTMRGYERSTVLEDKAYSQDGIASDIICFIEQVSLGSRVHVIGHDWGAVATYKVAHLRPEVLSSIVTMGIPYCIVNKPISTLWRHPKQIWLSSYMITMQVAFLIRGLIDEAEGYSSYIKKLWEYWSPDWEFSKDDLVDVCKTLQEEGVADSATAYYRRTIQRVPGSDKFDIDFSKTSALILGGVNDGCMSIDLFRTDIENGLRSEVRVIDGVGHFMQREDAERIGRYIVEFIKGI